MGENHQSQLPRQNHNKNSEYNEQIKRAHRNKRTNPKYMHITKKSKYICRLFFPL